jgi:hypothetical protein
MEMAVMGSWWVISKIAYFCLKFFLICYKGYTGRAVRGLFVNNFKPFYIFEFFYSEFFDPSDTE